MDEAVTRRDGVRLLRASVSLVGDTGSGEDVKDLLLGALEMQRRGPAARVDRDPLDSRGDGVQPRQRLPRPCDVPPFAPVRIDLVPVRDHADTLDDGPLRTAPD